MRLLHYSDIENVYDDPERAGRLAGTLAALDGPEALVVGAGDDTSPGVLPMVTRGRQALPFFRAAGTDVETFGNHDFDYGPDATRSVVADSPQTWVSANVLDEDGDRFGADEGVVPWTIERVGGVRVGLFGVTDPTTDSINPMAADLAFSDPYEAAGGAVEALRAEGVEYLVAVSHLGGGDDRLAREFDLDVVLGGHVHSVRIEEVAGTLCTRPGVNGHVVVEVTLDTDGASARTVDVADGTADSDLVEALRERLSAAGLDEVVARVEEPIERTDRTAFGGESRVGNFVADAYRWAADADVGLQNGGGIREGDPLAGEVRMADLVSVLPFEEPVVVAEVTGGELLDLLAEADGAELDFGEPDWWHAHISGASVVYDTDDERLLEARVGGEPVDPDRRYRVATAAYLLHSDHEFPTLEETHRVGEAGVQHEVLAAYAREVGLDPRVEGRIRLVDGSEDGGPDESGRFDGGSGDDVRGAGAER